MTIWRDVRIAAVLLLAAGGAGPLSVPAPHLQLCADALVDDAFAGSTLNSCRWDRWNVEGGAVSQSDELFTQTSTTAPSSSGGLMTQYQFTGDFDVEVAYRQVSGWTDGIQDAPSFPHIEAAFGLYAGASRYLQISRLRSATSDIVKPFTPIASLSSHNSVSVTVSGLSGGLRIARTGSQIQLLYRTGSAWTTLDTLNGIGEDVTVFFRTSTINVTREVKTAFDDFRVNSGSTTYRAVPRSTVFRDRSGFTVGGTYADYLANQVWGTQWKTQHPFDLLKPMGLAAVRAGVTTISDPSLAARPVSQWSTLVYKDSFWSSREYTQEMLRQAQARGMPLSLFFFLSDQAAYYGRQHAPPAWANLSIADTATAVEAHTNATVTAYKQAGLSIARYELGNEIDIGILDFVPGSRITIPPGTDFVNDYDYLRQNVWNVEAPLLSAGIRGVRRADGQAKIGLHIAGLSVVHGVLFSEAFFDAMIDAGVDFDYAAVSLPYPSLPWDLDQYDTLCWYQRIAQLSDHLAKRGKTLEIAEASYPRSATATVASPMKEFPYSSPGQAGWFRELLRFLSNETNVSGFSWFYADYFPAQSSGAADLVYSGLLDSETAVAEAGREARVTVLHANASASTTGGRGAQFTAAASGLSGPYTYRWNFGDGTATETAPSTTHTYAANGTYTWSVDVAAADGTSVRQIGTVSTAVLAAASLDRATLRFAATNQGSSFQYQTPAQSVRLTAGGGVTWTATSNKPWLTVTPASGSTSSTLTVSVKYDSVLPSSGTATGTITIALTGASNTVGPIAVTLAIQPSGGSPSLPFGSFDTPAGDSTVLAGSIALTGWTLDNIGVQRVELWRDLQPGETTTPFASTPSDPRNGKIFIANATFVDGARPDVEALNPSTPASYRAGWGYLLLTWGLFGQGNGTYKLYAFAFDQESNVATIGTKTIVVSNNAATKPFGSIDTPAIGGDPGVSPNFGWGLTPKVNGAATCRIPSNGVQVSIDSGPLQPVVYGDARSDIAAAFPGFSNTPAAGGHFTFDWSALTNGPHTIGWLITDDCNRADGVGSRFFNVTTGTSALRTAAPAGTERTDTAHPAILLARGYGELPEIVESGLGGSTTIDVRQGERIELRLPREFESAYQVGPSGEERALPVGSTWDPDSSTFYWQPAPGFLGRYRFVFSHGRDRIAVRVIVTAAR